MQQGDQGDRKARHEWGANDQWLRVRSCVRRFIDLDKFERGRCASHDVCVGVHQSFAPKMHRPPAPFLIFSQPSASQNLYPRVFNFSTVD